MKSAVKSYFFITVGTILVVLGVYFFEFTNNFSTGGVSGTSVVLSKLIGNISPAKIATILNLLLLLLGYIVLGKGFALKTVYASLLFTILLNLLEAFVPVEGPFTDQKMLELFFDMILVSLGVAILFNEEASSGGTDIVALILKKYTGLEIGKALLIVDFFVICAALVVFGIELGMFSLFAIVVRSLVVDNAIEGFNASKFFLIVTEKEEEITKFITDELDRGATIINGCEGVYTGDKKRMLVCVVDKRQAVMLKHKIRALDENAFTIIGTSSDIIGDGFRIV